MEGGGARRCGVCVCGFKETYQAKTNLITLAYRLGLAYLQRGVGEGVGGVGDEQVRRGPGEDSAAAEVREEQGVDRGCVAMMGRAVGSIQE